MKSKEFHSMSETDLYEKLGEAQKELIKLNAQIATKTALKNPAKVKNTKKVIALIKGLLHKKFAETEKGGEKTKWI